MSNRAWRIENVEQYTYKYITNTYRGRFQNFVYNLGTVQVLNADLRKPIGQKTLIVVKFLVKNVTVRAYII